MDHAELEIETYNGWVPSDTPVHDEAASATHWNTLLSVFAATLKRVAA